MDKTEPILEFDGVTVASDTHIAAGMCDVGFRLEAGEIGLVEVEEGREHVPLADAAEGLVTPEKGVVRFMGEAWAEMSARRQAERRGRIRRVFQHYGWISNLDVLENVCLAECHHTDRPQDDIVNEAMALARQLGVTEIPGLRPSRVHPLVLRKLEWVRAVLGQPALVLLERPLLGAPRGDAPLLIELVVEEARRGAAVLWVTDEPVVRDCRRFERVRRFTMEGDRLRTAAPEGA